MGGKINEFVHSQAVFSACLLSVVYISALTLSGVLFVMGMPQTIGLTLFTVCQLTLSFITILIMRKLHIFDRNDFKFKNMVKGLLLGWLSIAFSIIIFLLKTLQLPEYSLIAPSPLNLLIVVLHPFIGTGLLEEVLVRGLLLKILLKKKGHSKRGIINACVISSAIFGLAHIVNLTHMAVSSVISQIIYATAVGLFYAALYLRTKTLWVPILLHGLFNLSSQVIDAITLLPDAQPRVDIDIVGFIVNTLLIAVPFLIAGLVLLRKVKPDEITEKKNFVQ